MAFQLLSTEWDQISLTDSPGKEASVAIRRLSEEQLRRGLDEVIHLQGRIRSIIDTIKAIEAKQTDPAPPRD